jgi:hypothetical protein
MTPREVEQLDPDEYRAFVKLQNRVRRDEARATRRRK